MIEGVKSLAMLAKERTKKKMSQQMTDTLECKHHAGPVTARGMEKVKSFTESEIIAQAFFSKEDNCT